MALAPQKRRYVVLSHNGTRGSVGDFAPSWKRVLRPLEGLMVGENFPRLV